MPDFSMCARADCPLSQRCRRHEDSGTRPKPHWQSWMPFGPPDDCDSFWPCPEQPAGIAPAGHPNSDAPADAPAGVSANRPVGALGSGRPPHGA